MKFSDFANAFSDLPDELETMRKAIDLKDDGQVKQTAYHFPKEKLYEGLRYLLVTNPELKHYIETPENSQSYEEIADSQAKNVALYKNEPFFVLNGTDWCMYDLMTASNLALLENSDLDEEPEKCDEESGAILGCICISIAAMSCLVCGGKNSYDTICNPQESTLMKAAKLVLYLLSFGVPTGVAIFYFNRIHIDKIDKLDAPYKDIAQISFKYLLPIMIGALSFAITSFIGKHLICEREPEAEILDQLKPIAAFLMTHKTAAGSRQRALQCALVSYYLNEISHEKMLEKHVKWQPLNQNSLFYQPQNHNNDYDGDAQSLNSIKIVNG